MAGNSVVIEFIGDTSRLSSAITKANAELGETAASAGKWAVGLAAIAGGTAAIGASVGVLAGLGLAFATVKLATGGATDALTDYNAGLKSGNMKDYQKDLAKMSPVQKQFTLALVDTENQFKQVTKAAQDTFLPGATKALKSVTGLFPILATAIGQTGTTLSGLASQMATLFSSSDFKTELATVFSSSQPIIQSIGQLLIGVIGDLVEFGSKMGPAFLGFSDLIDDVKEGLGQFFDVLDAPGNADLFKGVLDSLGSIIRDLLPDLATIALTITQDVAPALAAFAKWFHDNQATVKDWIPVILGFVLAIKGLSIAKDVITWGAAIVKAFQMIGASATASAGFVNFLKDAMKTFVVPAAIALGVGALAYGAAKANSGPYLDHPEQAEKPLDTGKQTAQAGNAGFASLVDSVGSSLSSGSLDPLGKWWDEQVKQFVAQTGPGSTVQNAWQSFVGFITGSSIFPASDGIRTWIANTATAIGTFFTNLPGQMKGWLDTVDANIDAFWASLPAKAAYALGYLGGIIANGAIAAWNFLTSTLPGIITSVVTWLGGLPAKAIAALATLGPQVGALATTAWTNFENFTVTALTAALTWIQGVPAKVGAFLTSLPGIVGTAATTAWNSFRDMTISAGTAAQTWIQGLPARVGGFIASLPGIVTAAATSAWNGFQSQTIAIGTSAQAWIQGLPGRITGFFGNAGTLLYNAGAQIVQGLWNGLQSKVAGIMSFISNLGAQVAAGFKAATGIASPSKVFAEMGEYLGKGLIVGINNITPSVVSSAVGMSDQMTNAAVPSLSYSASGSSSNQSGSPTVSFAGNTSDALATVIMQLIRSGKIVIA